MTKTMTGGCQCGRVRYSAELDSNEAALCHCNMCKRATGGLSAALVGLKRDRVQWDGEPAWYDSSAIAQRGFCDRCGSPIAFRFRSGESIDLTIGSFDDPAWFVNTGNMGAESIVEHWLDASGLIRRRTDENKSVVEAYREAGQSVP